MEPQKLKAKNTYYNGILFRSRLEARWGVWLDEMEKKYSYEHEGFELNCGSYLPDFWLYDDRMWIEIKPDRPSSEEIEKAVELEQKTGFPVIFFCGTPWPSECFRVHYKEENGSFKEIFYDTWEDSIQDYKLVRAFQKARKARFEFGETPSRQTRFPFYL